MTTLPSPDPIPGGPPFTSWRRLGLQPDQAVYIGRDDQLFVRTRASLAVHVSAAVRLQQPEDGRITPQLFDVVTVADRSEQIAVFALAEGYLLGAVVFSVDANMVEGAVYVELGVIRGGAGLISRVQLLAAGYLGIADAISWPHVTQPPSSADAGRFRNILGADPAAGAQSTETVPAGAHWDLLSWRIPLVTDATVANRLLHLVIDDGANIVIDTIANAVQAASLTRNYNSVHYGISPGTGDNELYVPLPQRLHLEAGWRIRTTVTLMAAGDNLGPPRYVVREEIPG